MFQTIDAFYTIGYHSEKEYCNFFLKQFTATCLLIPNQFFNHIPKSHLNSFKLQTLFSKQGVLNILKNSIGCLKNLVPKLRNKNAFTPPNYFSLVIQGFQLLYAVN